MICKVICWCSILLVLLPMAVWAQSPHEGMIGLGGHVAWWEPKDAEESTTFYGAQTRFRLTDGLALEGSIDYYQEEFGHGDFILYPVQASMIIYIIPSRLLELYGLLGIGWYIWEFNADSNSPAVDDDGSELGYHAGLGGELPLLKHLSLHLDFRWVVFKPDLDNGADDWSGLWTNFGVSLYF